MNPVADLQQRLSGLGVPVLPPEDIELPLKGGRGGERGGLALYLSPGHPGEGGYVQLYEPRESNFLDLDQDEQTLDVIASDRARVHALAAQVRLLLAGTEEAPGDHVLLSRTPLPGPPFYLQLTFTKSVLFTGD